jgi:RNA-directed DNA polymerase
MWAGMLRVPVEGDGQLLGPVDVAGREAIGNAWGVPVAMRQGHSWAPPWSSAHAVNVGTVPLSVLDEHFTRKWEALGPSWTRAKRIREGVQACRIVRYADDFVVMVKGTRADAEALWIEVSGVLAPMGFRLSVQKSGVCHIDEGFDFLGFRIQRRPWTGRRGKQAVYTYPSKRSLQAVIDKVRTLTRRARHRTLADLLAALNPVLRGWCIYFRHGASKRVFGYLDHFAWWRIVGWLRKRHLGLNWGTLSRRYLPGWEIRDGRTRMFRPRAEPVSRYRYRGTKIPTPWAETGNLVESRMR